jgi:hypothetical protein
MEESEQAEPMRLTSTKPRRTHCLFGSLCLLIIICLPSYRAVRRKQLGHELIAALKEGNSSRAIALIHAGADPNVRESSPQPQSFRELLDQMVSSRRRSSYSITALGCAVKNNDVAACSALLDAGADPDAQYDIRVLRYTFLDVIRTVQTTSVEPDLTTALSEAAWDQNADVVKLLVRHGANPRLKDKHGRTVLGRLPAPLSNDEYGQIVHLLTIAAR